MTVSKTPKVLILILILALTGAVVVAGCGGGSSSSSEATTEESAAPPAEEETEEEPAEEPAEEEEAGGGAAASGEGKTIFSTNCASCHTLKAAGASGEVGPNLDELEPDEETVEKQVISGGGPMPAFGNKEILTPEEIKTVSAYVAAEAGQ
jgi:mono/diheme cytochrome c family protein